MSEPLDLEPFKRDLETVKDCLRDDGAVDRDHHRHYARDVDALISEVERLRANRDRVHLFVEQVYGVRLTDNPALAEVVVKTSAY